MLQELCEKMIETEMAKTFAACMESKRFIIMFIKAELNPVHIITRHFLSLIIQISPTSAYTSQLDNNMKVKVKFTLEQATKAQRGGIEVSLYSFFNLGASRGWVVNTTPRPLCPQDRSGTHCTGGSQLVWTGVENLAPTGIRSPDCPARSESLHQLRSWLLDDMKHY